MQNKKILRNIVALSLIPGLGIQRIRPFTRNKKHLEQVFTYSKRKLRTFEGIGEASSLAILSFNRWEEVDALLDEADKNGTSIITIADPSYPELLKHIYSPPVLFWLKGNSAALNMPAAAVVGTRNPTKYGREQADVFSRAMAAEGLCVVSGLAYGIDGAAHRGALAAGGITVAVLGSGIDTIYPRQHTALANEIVKQGGAVITEFPPGTKPDAANFPVRNRIVSGMSLGTLVVESGIQGGSMITAELALDQNREVFAIPHSLDNFSGSGGNYLIKNGGAKLVQTAEDILVELVPERFQQNKVNDTALPKSYAWRAQELDDFSRAVCTILEEGEIQVDKLSEQLSVPSSKLLVTLLQLEMENLVEQQAGKFFRLR